MVQVIGTGGRELVRSTLESTKTQSKGEVEVRATENKVNERARIADNRR